VRSFLLIESSRLVDTRAIERLRGRSGIDGALVQINWYRNGFQSVFRELIARFPRSANATRTDHEERCGEDQEFIAAGEMKDASHEKYSS